MGIEPTYSAWKAEVLPLNYTRAAKRRVAHHNRYKPTQQRIEGCSQPPTLCPEGIAPSTL